MCRCWFDALGACWVKFETGYCTGRVKRDQRRGRPSRRCMEGLISRDLTYKAFLGISKRSESPGLPVRILKVYREVLRGSSQTVPPRQSQHPLPLKAASWNSSHCGKSGQNSYSKDGGPRRRLLLPGSCSWVNQRSCSLYDLLQQSIL